MKLKPINTESKGYKFFRKAYSAASYLGGCAATDVVIIPFAEALFGKKLRALKYLTYLGTVGLSISNGYLAEHVLNTHMDACVELWNMYANGSDYTEADVEFAKAAEGEYTMYTLDPKERLNKGVDEYRIFEFDTEDAAKEVGSRIVQICYGGAYGSLSIADYMTMRGMNPKMIPYSENFGWEDSENLRPEIEKIADNCYILDLPKYDYINVVVSNPKEG